MSDQIKWTGEQDRPLQLVRACPCGCDRRDGSTGVGYITGSNADGEGFSIWIDDEAVYQRLADALDDVGVNVQRVRSAA